MPVFEKTILAALACICVAGPAVAQQMIMTTSISCAAARQIVSTRGAIVLSTGETTYDRFVASQRFCQRDEINKPAWVPTADQRQCFIGYRCERVDVDWPF